MLQRLPGGLVLGRANARVKEKSASPRRRALWTMGWFVGQVMKASGGKANPKAVNDILKAKLGL